MVLSDTGLDTHQMYSSYTEYDDNTVDNLIRYFEAESYEEPLLKFPL